MRFKRGSGACEEEVLREEHMLCSRRHALGLPEKRRRQTIRVPTAGYQTDGKINSHASVAINQEPRWRKGAITSITRPLTHGNQKTVQNSTSQNSTGSDSGAKRKDDKLAKRTTGCTAKSNVLERNSFKKYVYLPWAHLLCDPFFPLVGSPP